MAHRALRSEVERFRAEGFFTRERAFSPTEVESLREAVARVGGRVRAAASAGAVERIEGKRYEGVLGSSVKWEWAERSTEIRSMEPFHHLDPVLAALPHDARLWEPVLDLLDVEALSLFTDKLNFKAPRGAPFPWHQDSPYWLFGCGHVERLVSVGLYLDDATSEGGCLWVVPRSHLEGVLPSPRATGVLNRLYTDVAAIRGGEPVAVEVPAGSVLFFHAHVVHGAAPNRTERGRPAIYLTYQPAGLPRWQQDDREPIAVGPAAAALVS